MTTAKLFQRGCYVAMLAGLGLTLAGNVLADTPTRCPVTYQQLERALRESVHASGGPENGGLPVNEWAAVVDRAGAVCAVARSGAKAADQWLGSHAVAVEKADTANAFDLDRYAISTANLWAASQPGGYLYGANVSNPAVAVDLYAGPISRWGTQTDPLVGETVGGVIDFGGGLGLYDSSGVVGGLGASGNTSCADHNIAWRCPMARAHDTMMRSSMTSVRTVRASRAGFIRDAAVWAQPGSRR